ncbi:MAG: TusE/DsrC/DsvC family sulfur relay protein [candidate division Zixibacteria bacterium]|nr:TusE/DsrC/DsvC family sulfur relay protein [candidate division Zixibacteria bacterium]
MNKQIVSFNQKKYELDRHGFLENADRWDENFAEGMAAMLGIYGGLTVDHWRIIKYLRSKFLDENTVPVIVIACAENKLKLNELRDLFPPGYHRGACKIAGINYSFLCETNIWLTYETAPAAEAEHEVDELGFLKDFDKWNERFAHRIAQNWDLPEGITDRHWKIINYLREFYGRTQNIPTIFDICKLNNLELDDFGRLFPTGYRRGACLAAGLPFLA